MMYDPPLHKMNTKDESPSVRCTEIGDLSLHGALEEIDGSGRRLGASHLPLETVIPLSRVTDALQIHFTPAVRS
jgi:hypothetical protein